MQEFYRRKILSRYMGKEELDKFDKEYQKYKAVNVYKQVFEDQFKVHKILAKLKQDWS